MEIIKREQGILVVRQYGRVYLRFMAGGISDKLYQAEISQEELDLVLGSSVPCELILNKHMNAEINMPDELVDKAIIDYLSYNANYSDKRKKSILCKLHKYGDIFNEFYCFVLRETYEDGVVEEGYCASKLVNEFHLSPLGAYNYLIYLREDPDNALAYLKAGLPRK